MLPDVTLNWTAIVVAAVVNMVLGWLWYSPALFGKSWMAEMGKKDQTMKMAPGPLAAMFVIALVIGYIMAHFVVYTGANTVMLGVETGFWLALGFRVLTSASGTFSSGGSWTLWGINNGFWLVSMMVMGGILASMR